MKQILFACSLLLLFSCKKPTIDNSPIESNWLLPLVKGNISINDLSKLEGINYTFDLIPADFNQPSNTNVSSPAFVIPSIGPFEIPLESTIDYVDLDTLDTKITLHNTFPITLQPGLQIIIRTSTDTSSSSNIIVTHIFNDSIPKNSKKEILVQLNNTRIQDTFYIFFKNIGVAAFQNVSFSGTFPVTIELQKVRIKEIGMYTNKMQTIVDTVSFTPGNLSEFYALQDGSIQDTSITGTIHFYSDNAIPVNVGFQMLFLQNQTPVDSLFQSVASIQGANVDANGLPTNIQSQKNSVVVQYAKLKNIEKANQVVYRFNINTNGYSGTKVVVQKSHLLAIQLVSDLRLILQPFNF